MTALPARIAFDPALPVKATRAFDATAERKFEQGETVDWRELGITEHTLHMWWASGLVYFEPMPEAAAAPKKHRHAERR